MATINMGQRTVNAVLVLYLSWYSDLSDNLGNVICETLKGFCYGRKDMVSGRPGGTTIY